MWKIRLKSNKFEPFWKIRYIDMFKYSWKSYDMKLLTRYSHYKQYQLLLYLDALFSWKKSYFCQSFSWHGNFLSTIKFLVHIMTHTFKLLKRLSAANKFTFISILSFSLVLKFAGFYSLHNLLKNKTSLMHSIYLNNFEISACIFELFRRIQRVPVSWKVFWVDLYIYVFSLNFRIFISFNFIRLHFFSFSSISLFKVCISGRFFSQKKYFSLKEVLFLFNSSFFYLRSRYQ